jgi:hypothetical protein
LLHAGSYMVPVRRAGVFQWPQLAGRLVHEKLDHYAQLFCPAIKMLELSYDWGLAQVEYATDVVFRRQADLQPIYETLVRTAIHAVKPAQVGTFLGRKHKLHSNNTDEIGNDLPDPHPRNTRQAPHGALLHQDVR